MIKQAGDNYSPSMVANYIFELVKEYNKFYQEHSIMKEEDVNKQAFRVELSKQVAGVIASGMSILGIKVPNRM